MYSPKSLAVWLAAPAFAALTLALLPAISDAGKPKKPGGNQLEYDIHQLDSGAGAYSGSAMDVNEVGAVVGDAVAAVTGVRFAVYWDVAIDADGTVTSHLSLLPGSSDTRATGVNNLGEVVGDAPLLGGPGLYWPSVTDQPLPLLPLPGGDTDALPRRINDAGIVCGTSIGPQGSSPVVWRVTIDENGDPKVRGPWRLPDLPNVNGVAAGNARDLSEADANGNITVAGKYWDAQTNAAVTWRVQPQSNGGVLIDPQPTILQFRVNVRGINNTGVVCGNSSRPDWIAMLWTETEQISLALLRKFDYSEALDLNDAGIVVGWVSEQTGGVIGEPVVWDGPDAKPVLLNSFLSRRSPFAYLTTWVPAINEAGVIVGAGWDGDDGVTQAFLAIPK